MAEFDYTLEGGGDKDSYWGIDIIIEYNVYGDYTRATEYSPEEYPEVEIECFRMPPELAKLLGVGEVLDSDRIVERLDIDELHQQLLQEWQDKQDDDRY